MALLKGKYVDPNAPLNGDRIQLDNNQALKGKNADGSDRSIIKVNSLDQIELASVPVVPAGADPGLDDALARKAYVDSKAASEAAAAVAAIDLSGKADLVDGKVPSNQLPSYVDDVIEVDDFAALPAEGEASKIYVTKDTNKTYRWSGSGYVEISASPGTTDSLVEGSTNLYFTNERAAAAAPVQSVAGKSGAVTLVKGDVGLGNVDNTSDADKPISSATATALSGKQASLGTGTTSQFLRGDLTWQEVATSVGIAQTKIVSKGGSDVTGDGTLSKPYATIAAAMASITDAAPTKRYAIKVEAGAYTEGALTLKPNVFLIGDLKEAVRVTASSVALDASFSAGSSVDNRSGMGRIILNGACTFDWNAVTSAAGKLYFTEVSFGSAVTMNGYNNAIAQAQFDSCQLFGTLTVSGINVGVFKDNVCYGNVTLNQHPNGGMATILSASGGYIGGTLTLTTTVNDFNRRCSAFLRGMYIENLTVDGASSYADADLISQGKSVPQLLNGGQLVAMTPRVNHDLETKMLKPLANNSHNSGDWGKQWMFNFAYVHASAGTDMYILSAMENYDPAGDTAGKTIFIQPDAYGLQANANGGNIELETAAVSGTGVRGKVKINAKELDLTNHKIVNLANATDSADAVNKGQMDSALGGKQDSLGTGTTSQYLRGDLSWQAIPASITPKKETFVLTGTDLSNGYIDCAQLAVADSMLLISGGIPHIEGALEDYTLSAVGGVTRITFTTYFLGKLSVGDRIYLQYMY